MLVTQRLYMLNAAIGDKGILQLSGMRCYFTYPCLLRGSMGEGHLLKVLYLAEILQSGKSQEQENVGSIGAS